MLLFPLPQNPSERLTAPRYAALGPRALRSARELLPCSFSPCTGRSGDAPALEQERAVAAVWLGPSVPYHPTAGAAGVPLPASPHLWGPARSPQSFDGAVDLLSARRLSAKPGRSGTSFSFGIRSDWARGARPCRHPCRAPAALVCGSSAPRLLFQSWVKGPFLPMARSEGGNQEFTRLVTEFKHPFLKSHLRRMCVATVQLAAELSWSRSPEGLLSQFPQPRGLAFAKPAFYRAALYGSPSRFVSLSRFFFFKHLKKTTLRKSHCFGTT